MVSLSHYRGKGRLKISLEVTHRGMLELGLNTNSHCKAQTIFNVFKSLPLRLL